MNNKIKLFKHAKILLLTMLLLITSCYSTNMKYELYDPTDVLLNCNELYIRMTEMTTEQKRIRKNTGISVTNVALLFLWWPSIAFNEVDANQAIHLIEQKKIRLLNIYEDKQCSKKEEMRKKRRSWGDDDY